MIYSPDHKFLMIKNVKVGGTSLEVELSKVLPDNAVVTPINPSNVDHIPRNYGNFYNHISYKLIKERIDLSDVKSYVFVRNPYNIQLSMLFYRLKEKNIVWNETPTWKKDKLLNLFFSQTDHSFGMQNSTKNIYTINKSLAVDRVLMYENGIEYEINSVLPSHGIQKIKMKTFEKQYRPKKYTVKNTFKDKHLEKIYNEWEWEFKEFGYKQ
jgi:hypothetical protein